MRTGVFGKLPARRDYVSHGLDPGVLAVIDPWVQAVVAGSREILGTGWQAVFLAAPIWRFWLGRDIAGGECLGIVMPSVDGVGRYMPLCLIAQSPRALGPPDIAAQPAWFAAAEDLALATLAEGAGYEQLLSGLSTLPDPEPAPGGPVGISQWWVMGTTPPVLTCEGLPSPREYAMMLGKDATGGA